MTNNIRETYLSLPSDALINLKKEVINIISKEIIKNKFENITMLQNKIETIEKELQTRGY